MNKRQPPNTDAELAHRLAEAFVHVAHETDEEVDEELRSAGLDPSAVGAEVDMFLETLLQASPHDWRQAARHARARMESRRARRDVLVGWPRAQLLDRLRALGPLPAEVGVQHRNLDTLADEDLASMVADIEALAEDSE